MKWPLPTIVLTVLVLVSYLVFFKKKSVEPISQTEVVEDQVDESNENEPAQETNQDSSASPKPAQGKATPTTQASGNESKVDLAGPVNDAYECFDMRAPFVESDQVIDHFEAQFGKARDQQEIWSDIKMTGPNGEENRYRIETRGFSDPVPIKDVYMVNKNPRESFDSLILEDAKPEQIEKLFGGGTVTLKETTSFAIFDNGERLEWTTANGQLKTFEMMRDERIFRCENVASRESCSCIK